VVAAPDYTVDGLVTSLRNKYVTPASQQLFQDADVVRFLDEEMRADIIPVIESAGSEFFVQNFDIKVTGQASYTIPQRSAGAVLRDVVFVDTQGNEIDMQQLSPVQIKSTFPFGFQLPLYTFGYYVADDQVFLYPQQAINATQYTLRLKIFRRPNNLTLSINCGQITNISGNVLTLGNLPTDWTTGTVFDIIQNFPQFNSIVDGATITNVNSLLTKITLTTVPSGLKVGEWVCPTLMTCVPQLPYEAWSLLVWRGVLTLSDSLGDSQGTQLAEKRYADAKQKLISLIEPRVKGGTKKVVNRNSPYSFGTLGTPFLR
jgi:hypothetical protein